MPLLVIIIILLLHVYKIPVIFFEEIGIVFSLLFQNILRNFRYINMHAVRARSTKVYSFIKIYKFCFLSARVYFAFFIIYSFFQKFNQNNLFYSHYSFYFSDLSRYVIRVLTIFIILKNNKNFISQEIFNF